MTVGTLESLRRRTRQLGADPVLRRWLWGRALGRWPAARTIDRARPPYLDGLAVDGTVPPRDGSFASLPDGAPDSEIILHLPGESVRLAPGEEAALMRRGFADTETLLALHRFAWLPVMGDAVPPSWVSALWRAWRAAHGAPDESWAWHPYTAAERAINLLDHAVRRGLPEPRGDTLALLARHAAVIFEKLEYFGEHYTGNHLSNNGRGLFRLGLALGDAASAETGGRILLEEAGRIFGASGVLREGSTHYHLLLARNYVDAWLAARVHNRPEAAALEDIARRALAVLPHLALPGGLPLVGDISPDCPPKFLAGLLPGGDPRDGWCGLLQEEAREALAALKKAATGIADRKALGADGWWQVDAGSWAALWHVAPGGWSPTPGHGHQDLGSFEVHFEGIPLFRDPGRGAYGEHGEAAAYVAARAHNSLTVDDRDPYPPNRAFYDDAFRRRIGGPSPEVRREQDGLALRHHGFARLPGLGAATRRCTFAGNVMTVADTVDGSGRHTVRRWLHTTGTVTADNDGAMIEAGGRRFRLTGSGEIAVAPGKCWTAYGVATPATVIGLVETARLPHETVLTVEAL